MEHSPFFAGPLLDLFPAIFADFGSNGLFMNIQKVNSNLNKIFYWLI